MATELKKIYSADTAELALKRLEDFEQGPLGKKIPAIAQCWRRVWEQVVPFFAYPNEIRKIIYTTNAIESLHMQLRKVLKTRGHFPSDEAATKLIYLALRDITKKWKNPPVTWKLAAPNLPFDLVKDSLPWRSEAVKPIIAKARKTTDGRWSRSGSTRYLPTIAFLGPARCCDVTDLYQAFSQRTGPGRLWISRTPGCCSFWIGTRPKKQQAQTPGQSKSLNNFS